MPACVMRVLWCLSRPNGDVRVDRSERQQGAFIDLDDAHRTSSRSLRHGQKVSISNRISPRVYGAVILSNFCGCAAEAKKERFWQADFGRELMSPAPYMLRQSKTIFQKNVPSSSLAIT